MKNDKRILIFVILITVIAHKFLFEQLQKIYYLNIRQSKIVSGTVDNVFKGEDVDGVYTQYSIKYSGIYSIDLISNPTVNKYSFELGDKVELLTSCINPSIAIYNNKFERIIPFIIIGILMLFYIVPTVRIVRYYQQQTK